MKKTKIYKIQKAYKDRTYTIEGDLEFLKNYFSYIFEIGRSWNKKIKHPSEIKTIKSFITNLEKSYDEKEGACYERTSINLIN